MTTQQNNNTGGITFLSLLGITFIVLKLTGVIGWSWWLVTLPLWGGLALFLLAAVILGITAVLLAAVNHRRAAKRRATRATRTR